MLEKIIAFFMSVIAFFASLFGVDMVKNVIKLENLSYGSHERNVVDLYIPKDNDGEVGLILYIHGGAWIAGDKSSYTEAAKYTAESHGFAAATMNYRYLSENVTMADILDDIENALKCIKEKAKENGVEINKVLLTGHSAGGHLSMLYAYTRKDVSAIEPVAVANYAGPTDLLDPNFYIGGYDIPLDTVEDLVSWATGKEVTYETLNDFTQEIKAVSPLYYVDKNTVPTVVNHGVKDTVVPYSNALSLVEAFKTAGVTYVFNSYPNSGHGLTEDEDNAQKATDLLIEYANTYLN